jgi:hypothetical protein
MSIINWVFLIAIIGFLIHQFDIQLPTTIYLMQLIRKKMMICNDIVSIMISFFPQYNIILLMWLQFNT